MSQDIPSNWLLCINEKHRCSSRIRNHLVRNEYGYVEFFGNLHQLTVNEYVCRSYRGNASFQSRVLGCNYLSMCPSRCWRSANSPLPEKSTRKSAVMESIIRRRY